MRQFSQPPQPLVSLRTHSSLTKTMTHLSAHLLTVKTLTKLDNFFYIQKLNYTQKKLSRSIKLNNSQHSGVKIRRVSLSVHPPPLSVPHCEPSTLDVANQEFTFANFDSFPFQSIQPSLGDSRKGNLPETRSDWSESFSRRPNQPGRYL